MLESSVASISDLLIVIANCSVALTGGLRPWDATGGVALPTGCPSKPVKGWPTMYEICD